MTWQSDNYFSKAQRYWQRTTTAGRDAEQFLLQLSFVLEFVVRGALASAHPTLNAELDEDSIFFANGQKPNRPARSVKMDKALERIKRLIPDVTQDEIQAAKLLIDTRNEELHSDTDALQAVTDKALKPNVLSVLVKLAKFAQQDILVVMGKEDGQQALDTAQALSKDRKDRVRGLIKIHKDRFFALALEVQEQQREAAKLNFSSAVLKSGHHIITHKCPACSTMGVLGGRPIGSSAPILDGNEIYVEVRVSPELFECKCCDLKIKGLDELMSSGFDHEFISRNDLDPVEHFGIDPMDYVDTDEIIREYGRDMAYGAEYDDE